MHFLCFHVGFLVFAVVSCSSEQRFALPFFIICHTEPFEPAVTSTLQPEVLNPISNHCCGFPFIDHCCRFCSFIPEKIWEVNFAVNKKLKWLEKWGFNLSFSFGFTTLKSGTGFLISYFHTWISNKLCYTLIVHKKNNGNTFFPKCGTKFANHFMIAPCS